MNILFIDFETTGTDSEKNTAIEVACRLDVDGRIISRFHKKFFNPAGSTINLGALKVNKTKLGDLIELGLSKEGKEDKAVVELIDYLLDIKVTGPLVVSGQNVQFDIDFLKSLLAKYNVEGVDQIIGYKFLDTFSLAMGLIDAGKLITKDNKTNLSALAQGLGINLQGRNLHSAPDDVDLAADVYYALIKLIRG